MPGEPFEPGEVAKWRDPMIRISGYADGILLGGMTYQLAPQARG